jgi:cytochrome c
VDPRGNAPACRFPDSPRQVDEAVAGSLAVHAHGSTLRLANGERQMKSILLTAAIAFPLITSACDSLSERQVKDAAVLTNGGNARLGRVVIRKYGCNTCHEISGVPGARGLIGPPLTNIGQRYYIAGELANTPNNLMSWIQHPHQIEPHTLMPEMGVSEQDSRDIAAYLYAQR